LKNDIRSLYQAYFTLRNKREKVISDAVSTPQLNTLVIAGHSGTGKGTLVENLVGMLETSLHVPVRSASVGNKIRLEAKRRKLSMHEFDLRKDQEPSIDFWLDTYVRAECLRFATDGIAIIEGRLAAMIAPKESFRILLELDDETRIERLVGRYGGDIDHARRATKLRDGVNERSIQRQLRHHSCRCFESAILSSTILDQG
jgi:cytidylate kinase